MTEPITMPVYQGEIEGYSSTSFSPVYENKSDAEKYIEGEDGYNVVMNCHEIKVSKDALAEQDKRTRHAIADAVARHLLELGMDVPGIDGVIMNCNGGLTDG